MEIGAQLYTVRDFCKDLDGFSETLKRVADIGYKNVQVSGVCGFEAEWLKQQLDTNGLKCVLTHTATDRLENETQKVAIEHNVFDCQYVGLGFYAFTNKENSTAAFIERYKPVAKELKKNGKYFMYHNHDDEFDKENGILILDRLAEAFTPEEMGFILDTYWIQRGGGDPAWWIEKMNGRVPCIHLKDYACKGKMAVIGEGNINFDRVFEKAENSGCEYMLVEQDECNGENPFDCLERSYKYLHSLGFE